MSKIRVGDTLPDFELPDENGELHRLSELQRDNVMVLALGRGEHCPRERQHQRELLKFYEWCSVAFTELEVQKALDIREYTDPIHDANVPHTLVLSPGLKIESVYVGYWFWGRPSPYQLWEDLRGLFARIKPDFDPTTAAAKAAWKKLEAAGKIPAHH